MKPSILRALTMAAVLLGSPSLAAPESTTAAVRLPPRQSPLFLGWELKYAPVAYPAYQWEPEVTRNARGHGVLTSLEWLPFGGAIGKLGIGAEVGVSYLGRVTLGETAYTLTAFPATGFLVYRFDYFHNQPLVPFLKAGPGAVFASRRPTAGTPLRYYSINYSAGMQLCLDALDPSSAQYLDSTTGINGTYLVVEYTHSDALEGSTVDLGRSGLQFGLRFEM